MTDAPGPSPSPRLLEVAHVAHRLSVSDEYVRRLIHQKLLVAIRLDSGHYRIDERDLDAFLTARRTVPACYPELPGLRGVPS